MIRLDLEGPRTAVRKARLVIAALVVAAASAVAPISAQQLTVALFERYLDALRDQYSIPAVSAAVLHRGQEVWSGGLGKQDVEGNVNATPRTPYFIGSLSQIFGATLLLKKCVDQDSLEVSDPITRWTPYPESDTTVGQLLTHQSRSGTFAFDPVRFSGVTGVIVECADLPYRHVLANEIFNQLGMARSVPGRQLETPALPGGVTFSGAALAQYNDVLSQTARSYRLDRGRAVRSDTPALAANAATGVITTVEDLERFDQALRAGGLLTPSALTTAWTQASGGGGTIPLPTGLGWFVQNYNNEPLIWQFDLTKDAASSMIVKMPNRDLTFIILANSDGVTAPFALANGDATTSAFVRLFLRFFVP
jgi:CubicO group peptidase (beta-lactamase class C family)